MAQHHRNSWHNYTEISKETDLGNILPPSPEATSFAKFTEIPVSHYTGLPQISIPLYSVDIDGLKVPVGLSYHARGISVEEVASRVGIGWALNAGGAVVRQTRGKPDDKGDGYLQDNFYETFFTNESTRQSVYSGLLSNIIDLEPDRFSFNFLGHSGKFYFDHRNDKKIVFEKFSDIDIQPIFQSGNTYILGWIITTDDGFKYYFGLPKNQDEINRIARSNDRIKSFRATTSNCSDLGEELTAVYNSWQLIDIVSPIGNVIKFNYEEETPVFYRKSYDSIEDEGSLQDRCISYFSRVSTVQSQLKSIEFDGGTIKFYKREDQEREDLSGAYYLQYIEVVDNSNRIVKKYRLDYSYSYDISIANVLPTLNLKDPHAAKRLFLDSITELAGSKQLPPYKFTYTNKNNLPNRFSTSQDYWGYYNGKNNGQFLNIVNAQELADDKSVDPIKTKTGLLERITYPTGGFVDYTFEANQAIPPSYFDDMVFNQVNSTVTKNASLLKHINYRVGSSLYESDEFTINSSIIGYLHSNVNSWGTNTNTAQIINSNGSVVMNLYDGINDFIKADVLTPGTYKIRVRVTGFDDPYDIQNNGFHVGINWEEEEVSQTELIYSGGNRIEEIVLNDANGGSIKRRYEYLGDNGKSSGLVYALPCYSFVNTITSGGVGYKGVLKPGSPLGYSQGNHLGYSSVTEYIESDNGHEGKTQYYFTCMHDVGEFWKFPYTIPDDNESYRGKPLRIDYYEKKNGSKPYALIRRTNYNYQVYGESEYSGTTYPLVDLDAIKPLLDEYEVDNKEKFCLPLIVFIDDNMNQVSLYNSYKRYYLRGGTMQLKSIQNIDYFGDYSVQSLESFKYDNINNYQRVESQKTSSDGKNVITRYYYPQDYSNVPELYLLKQRNIISKPVDVRTYIDNKLVSGRQIKYSNSGLPIKVYQFEGSGVDIPFNSYTPYTFSHKQTIGYTSKGKIREIEKVSGEVSSFLWAYNNQYLLAKIENASYSEVESVLGGLSAVNNLGLSEDEIYILSYIDLLRNSSSLNNTQITSYTYDSLKGISSEKGPNNISTCYEYDEFGRLMKVKNDDEELLQVYQYHYSDGEAIILELSLSVTSLDFKIIGGTTNVNVISNSTWTVSDDSSWISVSPSSGSNNGTINITCDGNPTSNLRRGTVTVSCGNISKTISISQKSGLLLK